MIKRFLIVFGFFNFIFFASDIKIQGCCLNQISDSPVSAQNNPEFVAYHPNGMCVAVTNRGSNTISVFTVNPNNCALTPLQTISSGGTTPSILAYSPTGDCLAVSNSASPNVTIFRVNPDTCVLEQSDTATTGNSPTGLAFSPDGNCLIVANSASNTLTRFSVNDCELDQIGSPIPTNASPSTLVFGPNGQCLFVVHATSPGSISAYSFDASDCSLEFLNSTSTMGDFPEFLAISPNGQCLVVANENSDNLATFAVNQANCSLSFIETEAVPAGTLPIIPVFSPDGSCLALTLGNLNAVYTFNVNPDCSLTFNDDYLSGGTFPFGIAYSPDGHCLTVTNFNTAPVNGNIVTYNVFTVTIEPSLLSICLGGTIELTANVFGGTPAYNFTWSGPNGFVSNNQTIIIPNATAVNAGIYTVTVTDAGEPGCEGSAQATVTLNQNPTVIIQPASLTICEGQTISLTATPAGGTPPYTFSWVGPNSFSSNQQSINIPNANPVLNSGVYTVTVTDSNGCDASTSAQVVVNENPTVTINPPLVFLCIGQTLELMAEPAEGSPPYTFAWTGPNGFVSNQQSITIPDISLENAGIYNVTVTDASGCQSTAQATAFIATFQAIDEVFTTCVNQKLNIMPGTIQRNARFVFIPQIVSAQIQKSADSIFGPILQNSNVELIASPSFGKLVLNLDGSFTYIPFCNFTGEDSFIINVVGNNEDCNFAGQANVIVKVNQCCAFSIN